MSFESIVSSVSTLPGSYRILYTPRSTWDSPYLFLGLNPAGTATDAADASVETGNAYLTERWGASGTYNPLQKQVKAFFDGLTAKGHAADWCVSNLVFYRSPSWETMAKQKAHVDHCQDIWRARFAAATPRVIVTNGYSVYSDVKKLLAETGFAMAEETPSPSVWDGPHMCILKRDDATVLCVGFPHLSRYGVVTRAMNADALAKVYGAILSA